MSRTRPPAVTAEGVTSGTVLRPHVSAFSYGWIGAHPWARIGEAVGHDNITTTSRVYTHVVADETELDYAKLIA